MYKFRKKSDFNTDTPVSVEAGILRDKHSNNLFLIFRDIDQDMTTSEGVLTVTMFKGKLQDNDLDKVDEFVFSREYNISRDEFQQISMLHNRDIERSTLAWTKEISDEFDPKAFDLYKVVVYFQPINTNHRLVNQTYVGWG